MEKQENKIIFCACGCGEKISELGSRNRKRKYLYHHVFNNKLKNGGRRHNPEAFIVGNCVWCKKRVEKMKCHAKGKNLFCSHSCKGKFHGATYMQTAKYKQEMSKKRRREGSWIEKECATCGKKLMRKRGRAEYRAFCNMSCFKHTEKAKSVLSKKASERMHSGLYSKRMSKPHKLFMQLFENKFGITLVSEYPLVSDNGRAKCYDCKIPNSNILFEVDGAYWHSTEKAKKNDSEKDELAKKLGYKLYRIPEDKVIEFVSLFSIEQTLENKNSIIAEECS